jgi:integrase
MVRNVNRLTALAVKAKKAPGRYADGDGLYLYISPSGNRSWVFRYRDRVTGKLRDKGLGPLRDITLEKAREAAAACRDALRAGGDPIDTPRQERQALRLERSRQVTFGACADRYIAAHAAGWRNEKHGAQWKATLETHAAALIDLPVADIDTGAVVACLTPIWNEKTETASRVRGRIERILDWARVAGFRAGENPARWRGHLDKLLPMRSKVQKVEHRAALPYAQLPALMAELVKVDTVASMALRLQILTATRPGEATAARWAEFDLAAKVWTVPGERMKAGQEHRIPLAPDLLATLKAMPKTGEFLFPGKPKRPITTAATLKLLQGSHPDLTAHGFRSTFRDWAGESTAFDRETIEHALAHRLKDKAEAAYARGSHFDKRRALMDAWERYCSEATATASTSAKVTPIRKRSGSRR